MSTANKYFFVIIFLLFCFRSVTSVKMHYRVRKLIIAMSFDKKKTLVYSEYGKLPVPKSETVNETTAAEAEIEILLDSITDETSPEMSKDSKSTEEFILEQIKR